MSILFITGSANKLAEVKAILPDVEQLDVDLPEIQEMDPHKIIAAKLQEAFKHHQGELMVEDTSLVCSGLNGLPGPLIKWFGKTTGYDGLATMVKNSGNMAATARTVIGYARTPEDIQYFEGVVEGQIVEPRGETNFGWDPIFLPDGHNKTFAEMTADEKNKVSMRRLAVEQLKLYLNR